MSDSLYLVAGTASYQLHELIGSRYVTKLAGAGMPPVRHVTQRGPRQHGATHLDTILEPRTFDVGIYHMATTRAGYWTARRGFIAMLKLFDTLMLRLMLGDSGESFDISVVYQDGVALDSDADAGTREYLAVCRLVAYDPVWQASAATSLVIGTPATWSAGILPWVFGGAGITFGSLSIAENIALTYAGTWPAYPQIDIRGPITNPKVVNNTTGETLSLTTTINDGDVVRIDLDPLQKTVWNITDDTNEIDTLSSASDLATWHLAPDPEAPGGINALSFSGTGGGANTAITLRWHDRYIGL